MPWPAVQTAPISISVPNTGSAPATTCALARRLRASWSTLHERITAAASPPAARAWPGRCHAPGDPRRAVRGGAVHLPVPLRARAVVQSKAGRRAGELRDVLLGPVPLRHDLHHACARGAGDPGEHGSVGPGRVARAIDATAETADHDPGDPDHAGD